MHLLLDTSSRGQSSASSNPPAWESVDCTSDVSPPPLPFTESVGSALQLPLESKPVDFFRHLLDDSLIHQLVNETNQYVAIFVYKNWYSASVALASLGANVCQHTEFKGILYCRFSNLGHILILYYTNKTTSQVCK